MITALLSVSVLLKIRDSSQRRWTRSSRRVKHDVFNQLRKPSVAAREVPWKQLKLISRLRHKCACIGYEFIEYRVSQKSRGDSDALKITRIKSGFSICCYILSWFIVILLLLLVSYVSRIGDVIIIMFVVVWGHRVFLVSMFPNIRQCLALVSKNNDTSWSWNISGTLGDRSKSIITGRI